MSVSWNRAKGRLRLGLTLTYLSKIIDLKVMIGVYTVIFMYNPKRNK